MPSQQSVETDGPAGQAAAYGVRQREVPWTVAGRLLFGGTASQLGWIFVAFTLLFALGMTGALSVVPELFDSAKRAEGVVLSVEQQAAAATASKPIYAIRYRFQPAGAAGALDGVTQSARRLAKGDRVTVKYDPDQPQTSWIPEPRALSADFCLLGFLMIFLAAGVALVVPGLRQGLRAIRVLEVGTLARGMLRDKKATSTEINDQRVYEFTFRFTAGDGNQYSVKAKTHQTHDLEDERGGELIMYNPLDPRDAVVLDALPGKPRLDASGRIPAGNPASNLLPLALPLLTALEVLVVLAALVLG